MCGIAGIISPNQHHISVERLKAMTNAIAHRGPDGEGYWINELNTAGFGHRRLAIIDLSTAAAQPLHLFNNKEQKPYLTIIHNGEIYNYVELRNELISKGYQFRSQSDTEVILAAYDCWKEECLKRIDGMFAFAIWDEQQKTLFAARDRFGEKPFYYFFDGEQFLFASEMKALWAAGVAKEMNHTMLLNYIGAGWVKNPVDLSQTFYQNVFCLPQSHFIKLSLQEGKNQITPYWDLDKETITNSSETDATEQLKQLLQTSVQRRLRSDVAVGASLSGGLDSSSLVAVMNMLQTGSPAGGVFTASFPGFEKDETAYAKLMANRFQLQHYTVTPTATDFATDLPAMIHHQEEPFQSASIYAQYKVYEFAKQQGVTVILDGQGADEVLAGYHKYIHWFLQEQSGNGNAKLLAHELDSFAKNNIGVNWSWKNKLAARFPELAAVQLESKVYKEIQQKAGIDPNYFDEYKNKQTLYKPVVKKLNDLLYFNTMQFGLEELLRYADRNSMAHGVEVRLPFLQHELVQFIFSLPSTFKIKNGFTKFVLRQSMKELLPAEIVWRTDKIGYEPPQQQWMQHPAVVDSIQSAKQRLVNEKILSKNSLQKSTIAKAAHEADNYEWRFLCAAEMINSLTETNN
jgi:asparagine synthase (glutamine-hydrolysing)